jgi:SAM-dependent methyltransferase
LAALCDGGALRAPVGRASVCVFNRVWHQMGLMIHDIRLLDGTPLGRVLTLGRQLVAIPGFDGYLDDPALCASLGITSITSVDASPYEGASLVHDMNTPLPPEHQGVYDTVIDGGTLEHIFNVPVALASCMRALRVGGRFLGANPSNNLVGHGFYQFSPEFFYRVFAADNGFRVHAMEVHESRYPIVELGYHRRRFAPIDPDTIGARAELITSNPLMIRVVATKVADISPFGRWPQQSDYSATWKGAATRPTLLPPRMHAWVLSMLPRAITNHLVGWRHRAVARLRNRQRFRRR